VSTGALAWVTSTFVGEDTVMRASYVLAPLFCLFVSLSSVITAAADDFASPSGIVPSSATLAQVVASAKKAAGLDNPLSARIEDGKISAWGLQGTFRRAEAGPDFRFTMNMGQVGWQAGQLDGQLWFQDENGMVTRVRNTDELSALDGEPSAHGLAASDLRLLGETNDPGGTYVLESGTQGQELRWIFVNKQTRLVTRVEIAQPGERDTLTFSDFRKTGPYTAPWHTHITDGIAQNDFDLVTTSVRSNGDAGSVDTSMPMSKQNFVQFPSGTAVVTLPAKIVNQVGTTRLVSVGNNSQDITKPGDMSSTVSVQESADPHLLVHAALNGQGYDFYLDSGANGIFINSDIAKRLGLKMFGPVQRSDYGDWVSQYAAIPQMAIGDTTMTNVIAYTLPHQNIQTTNGEQIVGLVGYDFIANAVLTIDYARGSVTATSPFLFVPPAVATVVPLSVQDGWPFVSVQIGQASSDAFIIDTGSTNCFLSKAFAEAHPDDIKDQGGGVDVNRIWLPTYGFQGLSGPMRVQATQVKVFSISDITMSDWVMFRNLDDPVGGLTEDGLIGYDFLRHFTVYLDYPQNQMFLVANASFPK
jgi:hypothetical protein